MSILEPSALRSGGTSATPTKSLGTQTSVRLPSTLNIYSILARSLTPRPAQTSTGRSTRTRVHRTRSRKWSRLPSCAPALRPPRRANFHASVKSFGVSPTTDPVLATKIKLLGKLALNKILEAGQLRVEDSVHLRVTVDVVRFSVNPALRHALVLKAILTARDPRGGRDQCALQRDADSSCDGLAVPGRHRALRRFPVPLHSCLRHPEVIYSQIRLPVFKLISSDPQGRRRGPSRVRAPPGRGHLLEERESRLVLTLERRRLRRAFPFI